MSSRYFAVAAIMARAESLTLERARPSAQLMVESVVASAEAVATICKASFLSLEMETADPPIAVHRGWLRLN
jgi:hypothetical protein